MMSLGRLAVGVVVTVGVAACDGPGAPQRYQGSFTVIESPQHGPELCNSVRESLPPHCSGVPVRGWNWASVEGAASLNGTTWGRWHVTGTFDGEAFVLTKSPGVAQESREDANDIAGRRSAAGPEQEKALAIDGLQSPSGGRRSGSAASYPVSKDSCRGSMSGSGPDCCRSSR